MKTERGFTLLELLIVIAVIALLAGIAGPKFADLLRKSREAQTKAALGDLRTAISMYWTSQEATYPSRLETVCPDYLDAIPLSRPGVHHDDSSKELTIYASTITYSELTDANGWIYSSYSGSVAVNCNHTDRDNVHIFTW